MAPTSSREAGFALMAALWLVVLLGIVGLDFALKTKAVTDRVANARAVAVTSAAAEAGIEHAREALAERLTGVGIAGIGFGSPGVESGETGPDPWENPQQLFEDTITVGEAHVRIRAVDVGTRVNLNRASEVQLRRLMTGVRIDDGDADRLTQAILDWRDGDDLRRGRGAEAAEYAQAGRLVGPGNGPFTSVHELQLVLGMEPEVMESLLPFLSVEGSGRINVASAPEEVIGSIPGMTQDLLGEIVRARTSRRIGMDLLRFLGDLEDSRVGLTRPRLAELLSRVTDRTVEVLILSEAWIPGSNSRLTVGALAVRTSGGLVLSGRGVR